MYVISSARPSAMNAACSFPPPSTIAWNTWYSDARSSSTASRSTPLPSAPAPTTRTSAPAAAHAAAVVSRHALGRVDGGRRQRRVGERTVHRHAPAAVEQHATRLTPRAELHVARGEARAVGDRGRRADHHRVRRGAQHVDVVAGGLARDPLARAVGGGGTAVEAHRGLEHRVRTARTPMVEVRRQAVARRLRPASRRSRRRPRRGAAPPRARDLGVGVEHPDHDAGDAGVDQRLGTRRRVAVVVAGLERRVGGCVPGPIAGRGERRDLGVRPDRERSRRAAAHHLAVTRR